MLNPVERKKVAGLARKNTFTLHSREKRNPSIIAIYQNLGGELGKKTSRAILAKCFYHDDAHASMALYPDNNTFFCFACSKSGNAYQLIIDRLGMTFKEAAKYCEQYNLYD